MTGEAVPFREDALRSLPTHLCGELHGHVEMLAAVAVVLLKDDKLEHPCTLVRAWPTPAGRLWQGVEPRVAHSIPHVCTCEACNIL